MNQLTVRVLVFNCLFVCLVLPLYLVVKFRVPEFLWLYVPFLSFWCVALLGEVEDRSKGKTELQNRE